MQLGDSCALKGLVNWYIAVLIQHLPFSHRPCYFWHNVSRSKVLGMNLFFNNCYILMLLLCVSGSFRFVEPLECFISWTSGKSKCSMCTRSTTCRDWVFGNCFSNGKLD